MEIVINFKHSFCFNMCGLHANFQMACRAILQRLLAEATVLQQ